MNDVRVVFTRCKKANNKPEQQNNNGKGEPYITYDKVCVGGNFFFPVFFSYVPILVDKYRYGDEPNIVVPFIFYNMQQHKLNEAAGKNQPAPNKIH